MNKEVVIKKCNTCNSVIRVLEGNSDISCCGNKMVTLTPNSVEASFEKHMPTYEKAGDKISVTVNHVMDDDHYIEYILYVYDNKEEMVKFNPGEVAKCTFDYVKGAKIYSYCNKHGLWSCEVE